MVDAGDMIFPDEPLADDEIPQRRIKAELILDANKQIGVDASAVGDQDLKLGVEYLKTLAAAKQFPFLSANLVTVSDGKTVFPAHLMKTICGTKIGIFALLTQTDGDGKPTVPPPNYRVDDPMETARKEIAALKADGAQVIVALSHLGLTEDHRLAREAPGIDLIFGGHSQSLLSDPAKEGSTFIFQAGFRAKELGRVDLDFKGPAGSMAKMIDVSNLQRVTDRIKTYDERIAELNAQIATEQDADRKTMLKDQIDFYVEQKGIEAKNVPAGDGSAPQLKNQLVDLNREIADEPQVEARVKKALDEISKMPAIPMGPEPDANGDVPGPSSGPYVGVKVCQACHAMEYQAWTGTEHAKAYKTLVGDQHHLDFDCVGCHTTGYRRDGGPKDPFTIGGLANVQCEVCHGPGRAHSADPKAAKLNVAFDEKFCRTCHTVEQTGDRFVFAQYLPKVVHQKQEPVATPAPAAPKKGKKK